MANFTEIRIIDEYTIELDLGAVSNGTVGSFMGMMYTMISMEAYLANGTQWAEDNPVGTGPFVFSEYIRGLHLIMTRNDDYWDGDKPFLDGLEIHLISDIMTQTLALETDGEQAIDILTTHDGGQAARFAELGYDIMRHFPLPLSLVPSSDNPDSPMAIREVRLALSYAIDRDALVFARGFGLWEPAFQYTVPLKNSHVRTPGYGVPGFNPARARELLAEAGFPDGLETSIFVQPGMADRDAVIAIQNMFEYVGIRANVEFPEAGGYSELRANGWEGMLVQTVRNLVPLETSLVLLFGQGGNFMYSLRNDDHLESLIQATLFFGDNTQELIAVQDYMLDEALVIPLWFASNAEIVRPTVHGWHEINEYWGVSRELGHIFAELWLER